MKTDRNFYQGAPGLSLVLEEIEKAENTNQMNIFVDRISDSIILMALKSMGFLLDNTSKYFTIITWKDYDRIDFKFLNNFFVNERK